MSYRGRSCKQLRRTLLRKLVEKGLLQEVSRGRSTRKLGRTEWFVVFTTEIGIDYNQNKYIGKKLTYLMYKTYKRY